MNTYAGRKNENKNQQVSNADTQKSSIDESALQLIDARPEVIAQRKLRDIANNSSQIKNQSQLFDERAKVKLYSNKDLKTNSIGTFQLKVHRDNMTISATLAERYDFRNNLTTAMPVLNNQARCHIISYYIITTSVADAFHRYLTGDYNLNDIKTHLRTLLSAVYPYGANANTHAGAALQNIASANHQNASNLINNIPAKPNPLTTLYIDNLVIRANNLIRDLNDSPDNLRPAFSVSNSSIGELIDPRGGDITRNVDGHGVVSYQINGDSASQIARLSEVSEEEVKFAASNVCLAHSEINGLNVNAMGNANQMGGYEVTINPPGLPSLIFICD